MLLGALVVVAAAGCGGDDGGGDAPARTTEAAAPTTPDGLESIAERCQVGTARSPTPDVVPIQLRPKRARVISVTQTGEGYVARLLYDHSVTQVYGVLRRNAETTGATIGDSENEGRDAELEIERNGERTEIRLAAIRACPEYSTATIRGETA